MPTYLLADNGSTKASATLQLRKIAGQLSTATGKTIHPVSLMHANRIDAQALGGTPANVLESFLRAKLQQGEREFVVVPLFFGNSKALTSFIPDKHKLLSEEFGEFRIKICEPIYPLPQGETVLTEIILDHISQSTHENARDQAIVLVDHGSPIAKVTAVRQHLAQSVQQKSGDSIKLDQAVMERREGKEYDFNGQLLENYLKDKAEQGIKHIAVIMMFFLPGRHAGEGGDVVEICEQAEKENPGLSVTISPLIGEHAQLVDILADRLKSQI